MYNEYCYLEKKFVAMVLMHAEDIEVSKKCIAEFDRLHKECEESGSHYADGFKGNAGAARSHYKPIEQFGRYPTRNKALGRENTPEEEEYMKNKKLNELLCNKI